MKTIINFYRTTIGKKVAMAGSGLVLVLFILGHMAGNLKMFGGFDSTGMHKLDHYAEFLRTIAQDVLGHGNFLWLARIVLLGCLVLHAVSGIQLARLNRAAKPVGYKNPNYGSSNPASRTMVFGGLFLLCFIIFHLLHFTIGNVHFRGFVEGQVYQNVYNAFQSLPLVGFYILSMFFLCLHLYHGTWSMFQTLGIDAPLWNSGLRALAKIVAIVAFIGFCSVPVAASLHLVTPPAHVYSAE